MAKKGGTSTPPATDPQANSSLNAQADAAMADIQAEQDARMAARRAAVAPVEVGASEASVEESQPTGRRVAVLDPDGRFAFVDEADVPRLPPGARVLSKQENAQRELDEKYEAQPGWKKALGYIAPALPAPISVPLHALGHAPLPPGLEAYRSGADSGFTGGLGTLAEKGIASLGDRGGKNFVRDMDMANEAYPGAHAAGVVGGLAATIAASGAGLAGRAATPVMSGASAVGAAAEGGVGALAKALGMGARTTAVAKTGARLAAEGATFGAVEQAASDITHDTPLSAEKLGAAVGYGALTGVALGGAVTLLGKGIGVVATRVGKLVKRGPTGASIAEGAETAAKAATEPAEEAGVKLGSAASREAQAAEVVNRGAPANDVGVSPIGEATPANDIGTAKKSPLYGEGAPANDVGLRTYKSENTEFLENYFQRREAQGSKVEFTTAEPVNTTSSKQPKPPVGDTLPHSIAAVEAGGAPKGLVEELSTEAGLKKYAYKMAWESLQAPNELFTQSSVAKKAIRYLNGVEDVGETLVRRGVMPLDKEGFAAIREGTAPQLLPKIQAELSVVGNEMGNIAAQSGATVTERQLLDAYRAVRGQYDFAGNQSTLRSMDSYFRDLRNRLGFSEEVVAVPVQRVIEQEQGLGKLVYQESKALDPNMRVGALREFKAELGNIVAGAMDKASSDMSQTLGKQYKAAKRDYFALKLAEEAAESSAAKMDSSRAKALSSAGLGLLLGGPKGALIGAVGHYAKERAAATAATMLFRAAENKSVASVIAKVDRASARAAKGVIQPPAKGSFEVPTTPPRQRAQALARVVTDAIVSPEKVLEKVDEQLGPLKTVYPEMAQTYKNNTLKAADLLREALPKNQFPDPLNPKQEFRFTDVEAAKFLRTAEYVDKPMKFFEDAEKGVVTPEGIKVVKTLMPGAYSEFQQRLLHSITDQLTKGTVIPYPQRMKIGVLLDIPADASLRLDRMKLLQSNVSVPLPQEEGKEPGARNPSSVDLPIQQNPFDRLAEEGPGR